MSASELKNLILCFGLLFGHLVPEGNKHWSFFLSLRKIVDMILSDFVSTKLSEDLAMLIQQHQLSYMELFKQHLKPKFHILTHYPSLMIKVGPLKKIMTLRYESKHRSLKLLANVISSRINITYSLAIRHQLDMASRLILNNGFENDISFSKRHSANSDFIAYCKEVAEK
ncbi:unnamed protein product [Ceutorhynchus assimilis]|uniref:Uncharacterized protein n=1 Tax=Ceutorhynchus assimilis TaxID=467358 RepID=A0A9N9QNJ2_9CUCU|nr:unnamed protein product [Ceutorhynchus assimilis]